jgi:hypothetical protein
MMMVMMLILTSHSQWRMYLLASAQGIFEKYKSNCVTSLTTFRWKARTAWIDHNMQRVGCDERPAVQHSISSQLCIAGRYTSFAHANLISITLKWINVTCHIYSCCINPLSFDTLAASLSIALKLHLKTEGYLSSILSTSYVAMHDVHAVRVIRIQTWNVNSRNVTAYFRIYYTV